MNKKKIAIVTGTRSEYGIWKPVLAVIQKSKKLKLQLVATGMHLQRQFGHTVDDVTEPIAAKVPMYRPKQSAGQSLAKGIAGMAEAFARLQPDLVMVLGDRLEILAAASAALACQIPLAHLHGGETAPGQWDEQIRHAVTKMAHLHFCATKLAGRRIVQMGEDPKSVHVVGAPALDAVKAFLADAESIPAKAGAICLLHPSSADDQIELRRTVLLLRALKDHPFSVIGPNNDPGHVGILRAYRAAKIPVTMSFSQSAFWRRLADCSFLIGNSSSGILEAASLGAPVINLGDRQAGRERNGNVIDVPWSAGVAGVRRAIRRALSDAGLRRRCNLYGDGRAAERIVRVLESLEFPLTTVKRFHELNGGF